jgi:hypothetical protein
MNYSYRIDLKYKKGYSKYGKISVEGYGHILGALKDAVEYGLDSRYSSVELVRVTHIKWWGPRKIIATWIKGELQ